MKKMMLFALSAIMVLSMAACGAPANNEEAKEQSTSENVRIPNPWKEVASMDEAQNEVGFDIVVPESIEGYTEKVIRISTDTSIMEVIFRNEDNELCFRKGTGDSDISGDYNTYTQKDTATIGNTEVMMKGDNGLIHLAVWTSGEYTYSVSVHSGITSATMADLVAEIQ